MNKIRVDLQFHPYRGKDYCLFDVLQEMERRNIDCLAFLYYCWEKDVSTSLINQINGRIRENYNICFLEESVFQFTNIESNQVLSIILGQETEAENQKWHILSIGAEDIRSNSVDGIIEEILKKGGLPIIDHPFADPQRRFRDISKEKEKELIDLCSIHKGKIALEWNGYSLPQIRKLLLGCNDTNKKTEKLQIEQRKMDAERIVGGKAGMSAEEPTKLTDEEQASRKRIKAIGLAGGAQWAKKMDKEDGAK